VMQYAYHAIKVSPNLLRGEMGSPHAYIGPHF
jgi:hypothetical protein